MKKLFICALLMVGNHLYAETFEADTARTINIEDEIVITAPKENTHLRKSPLAVSMFSKKELDHTQTTSLKELSGHVPNFFMPDYGSSLTSATYIRGIGSRINTPAVGLYVDNVAYTDKSAYDISFLDVERIDILRGPQGTLYGSNTMGGLIRVYTRNPFQRPGTSIRAGFSSRDMAHTFSLSHHQKLHSKIAMSMGGFYQGRRGMYQNIWRDEYADEKKAGGGRLRFIWFPTEHWKLDFATDYTYTDEGGYTYRYEGNKESNNEQHNNYIGTIWANNPSYYRRSLLNNSMNIGYQNDVMELNSITAFQHLDDNMTLDQDFVGKDLFGLSQRQQISTFSEELSAKSKGSNRRWDWVTGLYAMHQNLRTESPVTLTKTFLGSALGEANTYINKYGWGINFDMRNSLFKADGAFRTPKTDLAVFHQSTFHDIFGVEGLDASAGIRMEHERHKMEYRYGGALNYDLHVITTSTLNLPNLVAKSDYNGSLKKDATQVLPKVAISYKWNKNNNAYISWSKGYRSGGFNVQMFGDLVQGDLRSQMLSHIRPTFEEALKAPMFDNMPAFAKQLVLSKLNYTPGSVNDTYYKPEYSYNYEIGAHLSPWDNLFNVDVAIFYMDIFDQQISRFVDSGLGRTMVNAGRGQSYGFEMSLNGILLNNNLSWNASYGYTRSLFKEYDGGYSASTMTNINYTGNRVPFVPAHQVSAAVDYYHPVKNMGCIKGLRMGVNTTGAGSIYWDEQNSMKQPFYALLNASIGMDLGTCQLNVWGKNLTDTRYDTFRFTSEASTQPLVFSNPGRPLQVGVDIQVNL